MVQGITGSQGLLHTERMLMCGTKILGGVNPRKAGKILRLNAKSGEVEIPVFGTVEEAVKVTECTTSIIFVPPAHAKDAVLEAITSGIKLVVIVTEGIPQQDTIEFVEVARSAGVQIIGPNCPGIMVFPSNQSAFSCNLGIIPDGISKPGPIGLVSKSGTLTYQMMALLSDIGFTAAVGIGGDLCIGSSHIDIIKKFEGDPNTKLIVMIGEIGGSLEQDAAEYIKEHVTKPVVAYVAGVTAPEGKTMGHAGAIIENGEGGAKQKRKVLEKAGVLVANTPEEAAQLARKVLASN
ncbi:MAG: succinate--CoA ligase subunit alpha [Candidatus Ancillula sp.]|nr:succinate--CoA ligase subunit alpha [Candidatus Ancillula sp.]